MLSDNAQLTQRHRKLRPVEALHIYVKGLTGGGGVCTVQHFNASLCRATLQISHVVCWCIVLTFEVGAG